MIIIKSKNDDEQDSSDFPSRTNDETYSLPQQSILRNLLGIPDISISWETVEYIDVLKPHMPSTICPLRVPGDGNCLLHSISVALWGEISYHENLRELLRTELLQYEEFYRSCIDKSTEDEESQGLTKVEYEKIIGDANSSHASLNFIHIFALANVLKRPIIVYASNKDIQKWGIHEEGCAGTFLPTRHSPSQCCAKSIALGWSNGDKNHFVPICPVEEEINDWDWPQLDIIFKKTLQPEVTPDHYHAFANLNTHIKKYYSLIQSSRNNNKEGDIIVISKNNEYSKDSITYNYEDDPYETAKKILPNPPSQIQAIAGYLTQRREEVLFQKGLEKSAPLPRKDPKIICSNIPMRDYIIYTMAANNIPNLYKKILQFNEEIKIKSQAPSVFPENYYILHKREISILESLLSTLQEVPKLSFSTAQFDPDSLDIVLFMLTWPIEYTWPVIDLIRVLVLQESSAAYYSKIKDDHQSLYSILINFLKVPDMKSIYVQLCIKVLINLFRQPAFHISLLFKANELISTLTTLVAKSSTSQEPDAKIIFLCAQVFQNYSLLWLKSPFRHEKHYKTMKILMKSYCQLLNATNSDEIQLAILISLGSIIRNDTRIYIKVNQFDPLLNSQNSTIKECLLYILECLKNTDPSYVKN